MALPIEKPPPGSPVSDLRATRDEFTLQAAPLSRARVHNAARAIEPFVRLIGSPPPAAVLDLACGPGILTAAVARTGARVVAVDVTPRMLELARERCRSEGLAGVAFHRADAASLPFGDARFPAALTRLSLHHFPDPEAVLRELRRVLRDGATLVVGDVVASTDPAEAALHDALETLRDPSHGRLLSAPALEAALESAGFRVQASERWDDPKSFDEWAALVADARPMAPVRVVMEALVDAGRTAGIDLRREGGAVHFTHHWCFVKATAA